MTRDSSPSIKVARVIARLNIGGPAIQAISLSKELSSQGFECRLLTGVVEPDEGDLTSEAFQEGIKIFIIPSLSREISFIKDIRAFWGLLGELRKWRPDILHTHTAKAGTLGRLAGLLARIPVRVHTFHGHVFYGYFGPFKTQVFLLVERILACFTDALVVLSKSQMRELVDTYHIAPENKFQIVPLGFDFASFPPPKSAKENKRIAWDLTPEHYICGFIGRLEPIKNPFLFVEAFQQLVSQRRNKSKDPQCPLQPIAAVIVGGGSLQEALRACLAEPVSPAPIKMVGWQNDLSEIYSALDVVVLTSLNEGTPVALIEAMVSGTPIVATNVGGICDLMVGEKQFVNDDEGRQFIVYENGILVGPQDIEGIVGALNFLLLNQEQGRQMGRIGRAFALKNFSLDRLVDDVHQLYRRELDRKGLLQC